MSKTPPKVIFVDGFNTVGKDHFIKDLFACLPAAATPTDPRVWLPVFQKSKRYWDFVYRSLEENQAIFNAHLLHLRKLRQLLDEPRLSDYVITSNRSFVSAMVYNYIPQSYNGQAIGGCDDQRRYFLESYANILQKEFADVPMLMVNLNQFHTSHPNEERYQTLAELRRRVLFREPKTLMNDFYLDYLIDAYQNPDPQIKTMYTYWEDTDSSSAADVVAKYFDHPRPLPI